MQLNWKNAESLIKPLEIDATLTMSGVYLRKNITNVGEKYTYQEVLLSNEYRYDILDMEEYMEKLLNAFKIQAKVENEHVLASKKTIATSIGEFSIKTPTYDFIFCLMALKDLPAGIAEGTIRFAGGEPAPAMAQAQVVALYQEFTSAVAALDAKFINYKNQIEVATTIDTLEQIEFIY